ncbi:hypothetical protein HPB51_028047 [Rhipicephalus microplus]|uniref:Uncharacterized protein n=1 Tax=Rhipicephalus microplus TaxID=6941 RepID=A0A9J6CYJ1_RHIMP|nr:hypothetical protein HPB51_028047 [Rhipicephalus microplus]
MGSSSPSTMIMGTPLPRTGDCFPTAEKEGYVTYSTPPMQELELGVGALSQPSFVPAENVFERTVDRCSIAPALGYVAFIGVRHDPSLFVCHDAAPNSSLCDSKGRPADEGSAIQPAPLFRCPSGRHGRSLQRRLPRFSRLFLSGSSKRVAEFGDPHAEQCVAVGDSRSCSCIAGDSRVFQQRHRRLQQRG